MSFMYRLYALCIMHGLYIIDFPLPRNSHALVKARQLFALCHGSLWTHATRSPRALHEYPDVNPTKIPNSASGRISGEIPDQAWVTNALTTGATGQTY